MTAHGSDGAFEIRMMIGSKEELGRFRDARPQQGQKLRLEDPMLVVTRLRPRIRNQDENLSDPYVSGERLEEQPGFRVNKMEMLELGAITLTDCPAHPLPDGIYTDAGLVMIGLGIRSQKMAVARADLTHNLRWVGKRVAKLALEVLPTLLHQSIICARLTNTR